jgi:hypothetical protein
MKKVLLARMPQLLNFILQWQVSETSNGAATAATADSGSVSKDRWRSTCTIYKKTICMFNI